VNDHSLDLITGIRNVAQEVRDVAPPAEVLELNDQEISQPEPLSCPWWMPMWMTPWTPFKHWSKRRRK
jgi:hypothetical protein